MLREVGGGFDLKWQAISILSYQSIQKHVLKAQLRMEHCWSSFQNWIWESDMHSRCVMALQIIPLSWTSQPGGIGHPVSSVLCTCLGELWSHVSLLPKLQNREQIIRIQFRSSVVHRVTEKRLASIFNVSLLIFFNWRMLS